MKRFRIKEIIYNDDKVEYRIQKRYLGFIWLNMHMNKVVWLSESDRFICDIGKEKIISVDSLSKAQRIKEWVEINEYCVIGYNDSKDIVYLYWLENESKPFAPTYLGDIHFGFAIEKLQTHLDNKPEKLKIKKKNYYY
ncbi:MAG: hypothetical protein J1F35_08230 [Erysipelotrichales bacterium]|nr:hypothetical protein [Erysipelotrichales bacterium]